MATADSITPLKRCTKCKCEFPATPEYFCRNKNTKDGLEYHCKSCKKNKPSNTPEHNRKYLREWRAKNPGKQAEYSRRWREQNLEKAREYALAWYYKNHETAKERNRKWQKANPEKVRAQWVRRYGHKKRVTGSITKEDIRLAFESQKGCCWWCGNKAGDDFEIDHVIPLSRGGLNTPNNIVLSCRKCNRSKGNKLPQEWDGRMF